MVFGIPLPFHLRAISMRERNARMGRRLFAIYLVLYGGFVLLNAFSPKTMEILPAAGINLAIWYGFGLILAAFVLAMLYGFLCGSTESEENGKEERP